MIEIIGIKKELKLLNYGKDWRRHLGMFGG
jgi:hypothetical protein